MKANNLAELVSLALTPATILLSLCVVRLWGPKAWRAIGDSTAQTSVSWFIIGVTLGFIGAAFDNLYWCAAWSASFLSLDCEQVLFDSGVYANIPFRQSLGIAAAFCHIKSAKGLLGRKYHHLIWACFWLGLAFVAGLIWIRSIL